MNFVLALRRLLPQSFKNFLRQWTLPWRLSKLLSPHLPVSVCVDVGASYYPHVKWLIFLNSPQTQWLAVEPNEKNLVYIKAWSWPCTISVCTAGLSSKGGTQILYVTNVDSGSSLLPPEIPESMTHRVTNLDYFFPINEKKIGTLTLEQAQKGLSASAPIFVKLDTQGTELSILRGAQTLFDAGRIVGIEMESTMLAQPVMQGAGKFWQACEYLEANGFELLHVNPIYAQSRTGRVRPRQFTYLNECDAIFALRQDVAASRPLEYRVHLMAFYITNMLYEEAQSVLERDVEVMEYLVRQGCLVDDLKSIIKAAL